MKRKKDPSRLLTQYFESPTDAEEIAEMEAWIEASEENRTYFEKMRNIWIASSGIDYPSETVRTTRKYHFLQISFRALPYVAAIAVGILIGIVSIYQRQEKSILYSGECEFCSSSGSLNTIKLSDNTRITLNSGSRLTCSSNYGKDERIVHLEGEGYFEVTSDKKKPFIVITRSFDVVATGTTFNVSAYPDELLHSTTLVEGEVVIEGRGPTENEKIELSANRSIIAVNPEQHFDRKIPNDTISDYLYNNPSKFMVIESDPALLSSWKNKVWIIRDMDMYTLAKRLERKFNVTIILRDVSIANFRFSGSFQSETIEDIMYIISQTLPIKYSLKKGVITLSKRTS